MSAFSKIDDVIRASKGVTVPKQLSLFPPNVGRAPRNISKTYRRGESALRVSFINESTKAERQSIYDQTRFLHRNFPQVAANVRDIRVFGHEPEFHRVLDIPRSMLYTAGVASKTHPTYSGININLGGLRILRERPGRNYLGIPGIDPLKETLTHEFGHWVDYSYPALKTETLQEVRESVPKISKKLSKKGFLKKRREVPNAEVVGHVIGSDYAMKSPTEAFAELFTSAVFRSKHETTAIAKANIKKALLNEEVSLPELLRSPLPEVQLGRVMREMRQVTNREIAQQVHNIGQF